MACGQERVGGFSLTMPLIANLRNSALRPRHWKELEQRIDAHADPDNPTFNLEVVLGLRLDQHTTFVATLSATATKELTIEKSLAVRICDAQVQLRNSVPFQIDTLLGDYMHRMLQVRGQHWGSTWWNIRAPTKYAITLSVLTAPCHASFQAMPSDNRLCR